MNTNTTRKSSTLAVTLGLLALSGPLSAGQETPGLWGEQFQNAYNGVSAQASTGPGPSSLPIWAGHFEDGYLPPTEQSAFARFAALGEVTVGEATTRPQGNHVIDHLLWRSQYPDYPR